MKLILIIMFVLIIPTATAIHYNFINVNKKECMEKLLTVPEEYFIGISTITVYMKTYEINPKWTSYKRTITHSYLWYPTKIIIRDGCDLGDLYHELAHHKNKMDGYTFHESSEHDDIFYDAYDKIRRSR